MDSFLDVNEWPESFRTRLTVPSSAMMAAGPTNIFKRVRDSLSNDSFAPFDKGLFEMLDEIKLGLQYLFQTRNSLTLAVMASGHGGMETSLCNLVEDGDVVLIGVSGFWSERAAEMAKRYGADVRILKVPMGEAIYYDQIKTALELHQPSIFMINHGDSSTGVLNQLERVGDLCHEYNCLLIVDGVASIGGIPFYMDRWNIDVAFTASQKGLGAPCGVAPISFSERAKQRILSRKSLVKVFFFDVKLMAQYWNIWDEPRTFHTTPNTTCLYGLREALAIICEEGLETRWKRTASLADMLARGAKKLNFELLIKNVEDRMTTITTFKIPKKLTWDDIQTVLLKNKVDIGFGLGELSGQIIRIGLLGPNVTEERVDLILNTLKEAYNGFDIEEDSRI